MSDSTKPTLPLFKVFMPESVMEPLKKVLMSGYIGQGPKVEEFEKALAKWTGNSNVLSVNAGTSALHLAMRLAGVDHGTSLITSSMTCTASNMSALERGAELVWADIDPWTGNIDPVDVERKITSKTRAILAIHWGGYPCEIDELKAVAKKYGLPLIEDAAHAFGATYKGKPIGSHSDLVAFSFQAIKLFSTVDGGMLTCRTPENYRRGKLLRWFGIDRETPRTDLRCLHPRTRVKMANGKPVQIRSIVRRRLPGPIWTVEEGGVAVQTKIVNWHTNRRAGRRVLSITTEGQVGSEFTMVTEDHKVLTPSGYKIAGELKNGDLVVTSHPAATLLQRQVIIGSLLGDGTLGIKPKTAGKRAVLQECHSPVQEEYVRLKAACLSGLGAKVYAMPPNAPQNRPYGSFGYYTASLPSFSEFRRAFYPIRKKVVPKDLIEREWSPMMLAVWFMDDGSTQVHNGREGLSPYCQIATNGFQEEEVQWLADFFARKGYSCNIKNHGKSGWRIFFVGDGSRKLIQAISPYVPPTMRYKVAHSNEIPFDRSLWGDGASPLYHDKAIITEAPWKGRDVFCVEVENPSHNFLTSCVVVANCEENILEHGYKFHMSDVSAVIGLEQLKYVEVNLTRARANAAFYQERLANVKGVRLLKYQPDRVSAYWLFTIRVRDRDGFQSFMGKNGVMVSRVHVRNDIHTAYAPFRRNLPGVDEFDREQVSIPVGWWVTDEDRERVVQLVEAWAAL